jgi:hypothetical protein
MPDQNDDSYHFSYRIYPEHACAVGRQSGRLAAQNVTDAAVALYEDTQWQPGYKLLWDNRGLEGIALDRTAGKGVAAYVNHIRPRIGSGKVAVVMPDSALATIADMLAGLSDLNPEQVEIFEDMDEALAWLEIPAELLNYE